MGDDPLGVQPTSPPDNNEPKARDPGLRALERFGGEGNRSTHRHYTTPAGLAQADAPNRVQV